MSLLRFTGLAVALASVALANVSNARAHCERICDGDTLKVDGTTYRLWGIDAPELHQVCQGWPAGIEATKALENLTAGKAIACDDRGHDRYGRTIAVCRVDGVDLGAAMVKAGMAFAFVKYSRDYVGLEAFARAAAEGVHAHECEKPWDWRARSRGDR